MADDTQLLYLEPDDEITTVVRRLREADAARVVLVASGRTKATTSAVALRLLAQVAADEGREIALVADGAARALAAEAGIAAFASVADASAEGAVPLEPAPPQRAPIHVVRGEPEPASPDLPVAELAAAPVLAPREMEETQAVPVQRPTAPVTPRRRPQRRPVGAAQPRPAWLLPALALALLVAVGIALGAVLPAASVTIKPRAVAVGPLSYDVRPQVRTASGEPLTSTQQGEATGHRTKRTAATGLILLINYSDENVLVPAGTRVSVHGDTQFQTTQAVTVPDSFFGFVGTANAPIEAVDRGPAGNVEANAIDTIEDRDVDRALRGQGPDDRRVRNDDPTSGGDEQELLVVRKSDITAVTDAIRQDLEQQLADERGQGGEDRIYATQDTPKVQIDVPADLEGHESVDPYTFELTGTLTDDQPYVLRADAEAAATEALTADEAAAPEGTAIEPDTVQVQLGDVALDGSDVVVTAQVSAQAAPDYDPSSIGQRIAGKTKDAAEAELASIGRITVTLWPFWVDRVPGLEWRINVDIQPVEPARQ
ncbi:MAG TPA: baseplate J/gp47 family protein [Candidatus Limnocylindria bacterium]